VTTHQYAPPRYVARDLLTNSAHQRTVDIGDRVIAPARSTTEHATYSKLTVHTKRIVDIGDRVIIEDTVHGSSAQFPMVVHTIGLMSSTFLTSFGEQIVVLNSIISTKSVCNHSRSPSPWLKITVELPTRTRPPDVAKVRLLRASRTHEYGTTLR